MREYETIFVTRPDGNESQSTQLLERVDKIIERHEGTILQKKNWGRKELAYKVKKYNQGIYHYYNYTGDTATVADLERTLRLNDLPIKYLTVKIADKVDIEARRKELAEAEKAAVAMSAVPREKEEDILEDFSEDSIDEEEADNA